MMLDLGVLKEVSGSPVPLYIDARLRQDAAVEDFGLEWRTLDPYPQLEPLSQGHLFGRFLLPANFFAGKRVADLGCGNGRLAQFVVPDAAEYVGIELSEALRRFRVPAGAAGKMALVQGSIEALPLVSASADVVLCWGVLHHVANPAAAVQEMQRVVRPGGAILLFVYADEYAPRENLNRLLRHAPAAQFQDFCAWLLSQLRLWSELDPYLAQELARALCVGLRRHPEWELFQAYDGLGPAHHHLLERAVREWFSPPWRLGEMQRGCFSIEAPDS